MCELVKFPLARNVWPLKKKNAVSNQLVYVAIVNDLPHIPSEFFGLILADGADRTAPSFFDHIGICVFTPFNM